MENMEGLKDNDELKIDKNLDNQGTPGNSIDYANEEYDALKIDDRKFLDMLGVSEEIETYNFLLFISKIIRNSQNIEENEVPPELINLSSDEIRELTQKIYDILARQIHIIGYCREIRYDNFIVDLTKPLCPETPADRNISKYLEELNDKINTLYAFVKDKYNVNFEKKEINSFLNTNLNLFDKHRNRPNNNNNTELLTKNTGSLTFTENPSCHNEFAIPNIILNDFLVIIARQAGNSSIEGSSVEIEKNWINSLICTFLINQRKKLDFFDKTQNRLNGEKDFDTIFDNHEGFREEVLKIEYVIKCDAVVIYKAIVENYGLNPDNQEIIDYFNNKFNLINFYYEYNNSKRRISIIKNYRTKELNQ